MGSVDENRPIQAIVNALREVNSIARENQMNAKISRKFQFDRKTKYKNFIIGDLVVLKNESFTAEQTRKLSPVWAGPYELICTSPINSKILVKGRPITVHNSRLKKYYSSNE